MTRKFRRFVKKYDETTILLTGGICILLIFLGAAGGTYGYLIQTHQNINVSRELVDAFSQLDRSLKSSIIHHRNFLLTGQATEWAFYQEDQRRVLQLLTEIEAYAEAPEFQTISFKLKDLLQQKYAILAQLTRNDRKEGGGTRQSAISSLLPLSEEMQPLLEAIEQHKDGLFRVILDASQRSAFRAFALVSAGNLCMLGVIVTSGVLLHHKTRLQKRLEHALRETKNEAVAANRAKSTFLANMSHELRTPLNGILGYTQLLQRDERLAASHRTAIEHVHRSGEHLLQLINEVLDLAKIEAGKVELRSQPFELSILLNTVVDMIRIRAYHKQLEFRYEPASELPRHLLGDEMRLRQVLLNLLGNAIKFTPQGWVAFRVMVITSDHEGRMSPPHPYTSGALQAVVRIRFEIEDTGIGIPDEKLSGVFQPFHQVHAQEFHVESTGLGLSISQQLIRLWGSHIDVHSRVGHGSRFWFDLDLPEIADVQASTEQAISRRVTKFLGERRKILVVDDHASHRAILRDFLAPLGFDVQESENGQEALSLISLSLPDVILMDWMMPIMNGAEMLSRLRTIPAADQCVIFIVSADMFMVRQQEEASGIHAVLTKPVSFDTLIEQLQCHLPGDWAYERQDEHLASVQEDSPPLRFPPLLDIERLLDSAQIGDIMDFQCQLAKLQEANREFLPFIKQFQVLANEFRLHDIRKALETFMEEQILKQEEGT